MGTMPTTQGATMTDPNSRTAAQNVRAILNRSGAPAGLKVRTAKHADGALSYTVANVTGPANALATAHRILASSGVEVSTTCPHALIVYA